MIAKMKTSGHTQYGVSEFIIDTPDDLDNLPINIPMGSTAFCISDSSVYMINSKGEWKKIGA